MEQVITPAMSVVPVATHAPFALAVGVAVAVPTPLESRKIAPMAITSTAAMPAIVFQGVDFGTGLPDPVLRCGLGAGRTVVRVVTAVGFVAWGGVVVGVA